MKNLNSVCSEKALQVEVGHGKKAADFTGAVVVDSRAAETVPAVSYIELVAQPPRPPLVKFRPLVLHSSAFEIALNKMCDRAVLYKGGQHFHGKAEIRCDARHVCFSAGRLHLKKVARMCGLSHRRSQPNSHTRRHNKRVFRFVTDFDHFRASPRGQDTQSAGAAQENVTADYLSSF